MPNDTSGRPAARPDPRPPRGMAERRCPATSTRRPTSRPPRARRSSSATRRRPAGSPRISCGPSATSSPTSCAARTMPSCDALELGGLRVTTTLDADLQKIAEKWVRAAAIVPQPEGPGGGRQGRSGSRRLEPWMANLTSKSLRNGALVALDYQTGELVAYVGSATTTRRRRSPSSSRSTTWSARAIASRVRPSSRSTTRSASTTRRSPRARC